MMGYEVYSSTCCNVCKIICIGPVHIGCGNCCLSSSMSTIVVIGVLFLMYHIAKCFAIQFFLQHSLFLLTIIRSFYCICHYSLLQKCCKTNVCRFWSLGIYIMSYLNRYIAKTNIYNYKLHYMQLHACPRCIHAFIYKLLSIHNF